MNYAPTCRVCEEIIKLKENNITKFPKHLKCAFTC